MVLGCSKGSRREVRMAASPGGGARDVANAVQAAPSASSPRTAADLLLDGWAALFADGCATATPTLREALTEFDDASAAADQLHLLWLATITAPVVWDDARWDVLSRFHVELARGSGALGELPSRSTRAPTFTSSGASLRLQIH